LDALPLHDARPLRCGAPADLRAVARPQAPLPPAARAADGDGAGHPGRGAAGGRTVARYGARSLAAPRRMAWAGAHPDPGVGQRQRWGTLRPVVIAGLDPAIHSVPLWVGSTVTEWMPGSRPGMTKVEAEQWKRN